MVVKPHPLESPESSSPIITRAVAAGLQGKFCQTYILPAWQQLALRLLGSLPQEVARFVIPRFEAISALDPSALDGLSANTLAQERLLDYADLQGRFPCITAGAALGGATAHLSLALGGPFLPQAYVVTLRGGSQDGDINTYFLRSAQLAREITGRNPNLLTIQHYDPIHDEWMTRFANHLRFKLLELPEAYAEFIKKRLEPGGTLCYLDCQAQWLRFRVGEHSVFQVGGWGDISAREYLQGSERIQQYCQSIGLQNSRWHLEGYPLESGPESEWGCEAGLGQSLKDFCQREGFQFVQITLPEPHDYSRLAFLVVGQLLENCGRRPEGVLVETFSQFDASSVQMGGLLPVWLVFNTWDSLAFLESMIPNFPEGKPVFFSPLATFTPTPDLVPWIRWIKVFGALELHNIGARPSHYPADVRVLIDWNRPLHDWVKRAGQPIQGRLEAKQLNNIANELAIN